MRASYMWIVIIVLFIIGAMLFYHGITNSHSTIWNPQFPPITLWIGIGSMGLAFVLWLFGTTSGGGFRYEHDDYKRRQAYAEELRRSQCYYCGGGIGNYYLTCPQCGAVLCSQRCYDEHRYSSHR